MNPFEKSSQEKVGKTLPHGHSKAEHLLKGIGEITASVCDTETVDINLQRKIEEVRQTGENIDYYGRPNYYKNLDILNGGGETYAISSCNDRNKYSESYYGCTGIIVVGTDAESGKEISILSHQDITKTHYRRQWLNDITTRIEEIKKKAKPGTVGAVIFGGRKKLLYEDKSNESVYNDFVTQVSEVFQQKLGFHPTVVAPPDANTEANQTNAYFDTQNRHAYILRPKQ